MSNAQPQMLPVAEFNDRDGTSVHLCHPSRGPSCGAEVEGSDMVDAGILSPSSTREALTCDDCIDILEKGYNF